MSFTSRYIELFDSHALLCVLFFFNAPATTEIYTLSLHDALPISHDREPDRLYTIQNDYLHVGWASDFRQVFVSGTEAGDRKSTRLNSSHRCISYAVFCLKKKTKDT